MTTFQTIEHGALALPLSQRVQLAERLCDSISVSRETLETEEDNGLAEAIQRDTEMEADPSQWVSREAFFKAIRQ
jgi:putative addiction module component (TIGR02574 family)